MNKTEKKELKNLLMNMPSIANQDARDHFNKLMKWANSRGVVEL